MNAQHTPGPWHHDGAVVYADAGVIVRAAAAYDSLAGDLDLIAAAPEMLNALRQCVIAMAHASANNETYDAAYKAADAVIEKATGVAAN